MALALAVAGVLTVVLVGSAVAGTTFTVNSTGDAGDGTCDATECTLREAIDAANATANGVAGVDEIRFDLPSGGTISPGSALPTITEAVTIDGGTTHSIVLNGASAGASTNGLDINASDVIVKGLVINGFYGVNRDGAGIRIQSGGSNSKLEGNYIGTNASGDSPVPNGWGVQIISSGNTVGGTTAGAGNVISGNDNSALEIHGSSNQVQGNYIGTNASGDGPVPNRSYGVSISGSNNTVGGTIPAARNVISGNGAGVSINGSSNQVQGNYIGTNASGDGPVPNRTGGVFIDGGSNNTVGGTTAGAGNVISGNGPGNEDTGVFMRHAAAGNSVLSNSIFASSRLGIDLSAVCGGCGPDGVTNNDPGDADTGPNNLQNFPVLDLAKINSDGAATIRARSTPPRTRPSTSSSSRTIRRIPAATVKARPTLARRRTC